MLTDSSVDAVDPVKIPSKMTLEQFEWWILFGICVAGKGAKQTEKKIKAFLTGWEGNAFACVRYLVDEGLLGRALRFHRMGQYKRINKAFRAVVKLDLSNPTVEMFEKVPGIGPKTARMLILYYDPKANCVPLDTHILKFLKYTLGVPNVPKSTPPAGKTYNRLERAFQVAAVNRGKTVRELDTEVWKSYAKY